MLNTMLRLLCDSHINCDVQTSETEVTRTLRDALTYAYNMY
jgi:hypothetical protein